MRDSPVCAIEILDKMASFGKCFQAKGSSVVHSPYCILHIIYYIVCRYNTVGWSIASIIQSRQYMYFGALSLESYTSAIDLPTVLYVAIDLPTVLYVLHID